MTCNTCQDRSINQIFPLEKGCLTSATGQNFYSGAIDSFCILLALLKTGGKQCVLQQDGGFWSHVYRGQGRFWVHWFGVSLLSAGTAEEAAIGLISLLCFRMIMVCHRYSRWRWLSLTRKSFLSAVVLEKVFTVAINYILPYISKDFPLIYRTVKILDDPLIHEGLINIF